MEWHEYIKSLRLSEDQDLIKEFADKTEQSILDFIKDRWADFQTSNNLNPADLPTDQESEIVQGVENSQEKETQNDKEEMKKGAELQSEEEKEKEKERNDALETQIKGKQIILRNGKVNQPYEHPFDISRICPDIAEMTFEGLEDLGLQYDPDKKLIVGTPTRANDGELVMKCKHKDWETGKPLLERTVTLIINPDPRSLWKNMPTPKEIEYYKPDNHKLFVKVRSKKSKVFLGLGKKEELRKDMVAASQRGRSHAHEGRPRDDDFSLLFDETNEWYVMTVADGAGSAKSSRRGSEIACDTVIKVCEAALKEQSASFEKQIREFQKTEAEEERKKIGDCLYNIIGNASFQAYKNISKEAEAKGYPIKDYATTLLLSICKKFDFGWFVGAFWVGDGAIGIYDKGTSFIKILGEPDGGEYAGQTRFLTMPEIMRSTEIFRRLRFGIYPDFTALMLMTDGISDPKFETDANLNRVEKWDELWRDLNGENAENARVDFTDDNELAAEQLLKWLDFWSQGNHDDRTIAILF